MKQERYFDKLYDNTFPGGLCPFCPYCGMPISNRQQFCCSQHEHLFYNELDDWMNREEEEYLKGVTKREKENK